MFGQKSVFGLKLRKQMLKQESVSSRYHECQFSNKTDNFDSFGPNLPKMDFWMEIQIKN